MINPEVRRLAEDVLRRELAAFGLERVDLREDEDHDGDPSLFIDAILKPGARLVGGKTSVHAMRALSDVLLQAGEQRFPYFTIKHAEHDRLRRQ